MSQITLDIPDEVVSRAREHAASIDQRLEQYLERVVRDIVALEFPLSILSDREVLEVSATRMPGELDSRQVELLRARKLRKLTDQEEAEVWGLQRLYDELQVRKAEGLAEAVRRGLQPPPAL